MRRFLYAVALCALAPLAAQADEGPNLSGFYVGANGGVSLLGDNTVKASNKNGAAFFHKIEQEYEVGGAFGAMVGYDFGNGLRAEGQFGYIEHEIEAMTIEQSSVVATGAATGVQGTVTAKAFLANLYYDFDTGTPWRPYIGAGAGVAFVTVDGVTANFTATTTDDTDQVFAAQVMGGIGYALDEGIVLNAEAKAFGVTEPEFGGLTAGGQNQRIRSIGSTPNFSVLIGLRWYFMPNH